MAKALSLQIHKERIESGKSNRGTHNSLQLLESKGKGNPKSSSNSKYIEVDNTQLQKPLNAGKMSSSN